MVNVEGEGQGSKTAGGCLMSLYIYIYITSSPFPDQRGSQHRNSEDITPESQSSIDADTEGVVVEATMTGAHQG